jgi:hypothetical protein
LIVGTRAMLESLNVMPCWRGVTTEVIGRSQKQIGVALSHPDWFHDGG